MALEHERNNKDGLPYEHYKELFSQIDPIEASTRCNIPFDEEKKVFTIRLMGTNYHIEHPTGEVRKDDGSEPQEFNITILLYRYLIEGSYGPTSGKPITYSELPSGDLYLRQFTGRCKTRFAYGFGFNVDGFRKVMEHLGAEDIHQGDAGYRFEFINGIYLTFILWAPDEDFPPNSQILFEDNFPLAFSTEDAAIIGDIAINIFKAISKTLK